MVGGIFAGTLALYRSDIIFLQFFSTLPRDKVGSNPNRGDNEPENDGHHIAQCSKRALSSDRVEACMSARVSR